jgi:hypothetical protein
MNEKLLNFYVAVLQYNGTKLSLVEVRNPLKNGKVPALNLSSKSATMTEVVSGFTQSSHGNTGNLC